MKRTSQTVRVVGGQWRSRKISFAELPDLRPTKDAIRETVFNWLQQDIISARCLDLFAGSGVLGIEALSRGAEHVYFVDNQTQVIHQIQTQLQDFKATSQQYSLYQGQAVVFLAQHQQPVDLVFLDPPFVENNYIDLLNRVHRCLTKAGLVYLEADKAKLLELELGSDWVWHKQKIQGQVGFGLLKQA